jgi:hypothetical protein
VFVRGAGEVLYIICLGVVPSSHLKVQMNPAFPKVQKPELEINRVLIF